MQNNTIMMIIGDIVSVAFYGGLLFLSIFISIPFELGNFDFFITILFWGLLILLSHAILRFLFGKKIYDTTISALLIETHFGALPFGAVWSLTTKIVDLINFENRNYPLYYNTLMCLYAVNEHFRICSNGELFQHFLNGGCCYDVDSARYHLWQYISSHDCNDKDYATPLLTAHIVAIDYIMYLHASGPELSEFDNDYDALKSLYGQLYFNGSSYVEEHRKDFTHSYFQEKEYLKLLDYYKDKSHLSTIR